MLFLELERVSPSPLARDVTDAIYPRRPGATGTINRRDALFLLTMLEQEDARNVIEIGVASGGSSLYILTMLNRLGGSRKLWSLDLAETYYADESRPVGYLALDSEFNTSERFTLRPGALAAEIAAVADPPFDFAFIDAAHRHPWPTLDFLFLLPFLSDGAVVALHDINLPHLGVPSPPAGPCLLFGGDFAERRVAPGDAPNIGAFRVTDRERAAEIALEALAKPWETEIRPDLRERLAMALAQPQMQFLRAGLGRYLTD